MTQKSPTTRPGLRPRAFVDFVAWKTKYGAWSLAHAFEWDRRDLAPFNHSALCGQSFNDWAEEWNVNNVRSDEKVQVSEGGEILIIGGRETCSRCSRKTLERETEGIDNG